MVEDGTIVRDFRFRGFPNQSMEKPTMPVTVPWEEDRNRNEQNSTTTVWVRNYRQDTDRDRGMDGLIYGERPIDNTPRRRGLRKFPVDPGLDPGPSNYHQGMRDESDLDIERYKQEFRRDRDQRERERNQIRSPLRERESRQGGRYQNGYHPDNSQYQPSFGEGNQGPSTREYYSSRKEIVSPGRKTWGIPVTDFYKHDEFEDQVNQGHSGRDPQVNRGGASSPRRGVPVTEFLKHEEYETHATHHGLSGPDPPFNRGGVGSPPRDPRGYHVLDFVRHDAFGGDHINPIPTTPNDSSHREGASSPRRGIPITDFIKHDEFDGLSGGRSTGGRGYRLLDEPLYDPFGRAGGGAPVLDSTGRKRTTVFGNFEKKNDPREVERDTAAKNRMKEDLVRGIEEQRNKRNQDIQYQRSPDTDLADLMRKKEVGRPRVDPFTGTPSAHQHLHVSDVSKSKMNYQPRDGGETEEYRRFLQGQMEDRERSTQQDKQRQRYESDQHFTAFDSQWGHFGGGAPKDGKERRKVKLDDSIHRHADSKYETNAPYATGYSYGI